MIKFFRSLRCLTAIAVLAAFNLTAAQVAWGLSVSRIIPHGKVKVYEGDRVLQVLTEEGPFPEGRMLAIDGQCGAHLDNFYLVATDQSRFGIRDTPSELRLVLEQGTTYFALSSLSGNLIFETPDGEFPVRNILINAASNGGLIKAYITTEAGKTEIGVLEGGSMVVATQAGDRKVDSGRQITIAQATLYDEDEAATAGSEAGQQAQPAQGSDDRSPAAYWVVGGILTAGAIGGGIYLLSRDGGGGGGGGGGDNGDGPSVSPTN